MSVAISTAEGHCVDATRGLTPEQTRFLDRNGATCGDASETIPGRVFVYRQDGARTTRWLIDERARVVAIHTLS